MTEILEVQSAASVVGRVSLDRSGQFAFHYDDEWLTDPLRFSISLSLPLTHIEYVGGAAHTFFSNLLPEGNVREAVCRRLSISPDNDFALLRAIGGECAGALSLHDPSVPVVATGKYEYEELKRKHFQELSSDTAIPLLIGESTIRLSLAGAQDKIPVAVLDGKLHLPLNGGPSTHILKLANPRYPHLTTNEAFSLGLARKLELDVVESRLFDKTEQPSLLVTRYDRVPSTDPWPARRLHQEDLCQANGLPSTRKYELEGGPSLADVVQLVRKQVAQPLVDVPRLIQWQACNLVIGNSDGHAKNMSLLYTGGGRSRLAPFYDILATRHYKRLDRQLAMKVGSHRNPDQITYRDWLELGEQLDINGRVVLSLVQLLAERSLDELTEWLREFRERYGRLAILQSLPKEITKRAQRVLRAVKPPRPTARKS